MARPDLDEIQAVFARWPQSHYAHNALSYARELEAEVERLRAALKTSGNIINLQTGRRLCCNVIFPNHHGKHCYIGIALRGARP